MFSNDFPCFFNCVVQSADRFADRFAGRLDELYGFAMFLHGFLWFPIVVYNLLTDSMTELLTDSMIYMISKSFSMVFYDF